MSTPLEFEVIATGNELLDGSILDRHTQSIAAALRARGLRLCRSQVIPDDRRLLKQVFVEASLRSQIVFVTGGLGPTEDDLSLEIAAEAFGSRLVDDKAAKANVLRRMKQLGRKVLNPGHKKQMQIPEGSLVLPNREGTAPGVEWKLGTRYFFFLPGVPKEFQDVFYNAVLPRLDEICETSLLRVEERVFKVFGWPESELNELIRKKKIPAGLDLGFRTHFPENHIKFRFPSNVSSQFRKQVKDLEKYLREELGMALFTEDPTASFEESVVAGLTAQKLKVSFAESCSGGLAASMLTRVPGSSLVFDRGFVTYTNESKHEILGVSKESLSRYGAVSEQVVKEMAVGALKKSKANCGVSISGIAGPTGGSKSKPVGTVWFGYADNKGKVKTHRVLLKGRSRDEIQLYSAYTALQWVAKPGTY